jgi:hypothetical protein
MARARARLPALSPPRCAGSLENLTAAEESGFFPPYGTGFSPPDCWLLL